MLIWQYRATIIRATQQKTTPMEMIDPTIDANSRAEICGLLSAWFSKLLAFAIRLRQIEMQPSQLNSS